MLGSWVDPGVDVANRIKRAAFLWSKVRPQLVKNGLSKRQQAIIVQTCVETGLLFDSAVRPWYKSEINRMQQWIDRRYRYVWSNKKEPPLITMEKTHMNMQDIRNQLNIKTLQSKIEKRSLQRIGHVLRMDSSRPVKAAVLGWSPALEAIPKERTKTRTTPQYWRRLVKEAGLNPSDLGKYTKDRKTWRKTIHSRMTHIERWEQQRANKPQDYETIETRNIPKSEQSLTCSQCGRTCRTAAGLGIHPKRIHNKKEPVLFPCPSYTRIFKTENTRTNHQKSCNGEHSSRHTEPVHHATSHCHGKTSRDTEKDANQQNPP